VEQTARGVYNVLLEEELTALDATDLSQAAEDLQRGPITSFFIIANAKNLHPILPVKSTVDALKAQRPTVTPPPQAPIDLPFTSFRQNQYLFTYNTRNCQRNVRNNFAKNVKSDFVNRSKRDLKINENLNLTQNSHHNPPNAGIARKTLTTERAISSPKTLQNISISSFLNILFNPVVSFVSFDNFVSLVSLFKTVNFVSFVDLSCNVNREGSTSDSWPIIYDTSSSTCI
jgi:hypothetical protein